jgi:hypothetical protein
VTAARSTATPDVLHNMSVPSTSRITVARARLPGLRFAVRLGNAAGLSGNDIRDRLFKDGWRAAWTFLSQRDDAPKKTGRTRHPDDLERHLRESLERAGIPDRLGVFLSEEESVPVDAQRLPPAAALAVLARRSGPLYLPSRRLEPSLADPSRPLVLFFPE